MDKSPFLNLTLTPETASDKRFKDFRTQLAGDGPYSNMMLIDSAVKELFSHTTNVENPHLVTAGQVGADPAGTASELIKKHNSDINAHLDILIPKSDIVDNCVTDSATKPLSASAGLTLSNRIDSLRNDVVATTPKYISGYLRVSAESWQVGPSGYSFLYNQFEECEFLIDVVVTKFLSVRIAPVYTDTSDLDLCSAIKDACSLIDFAELHEPSDDNENYSLELYCFSDAPELELTLEVGVWFL